MIMVKIKWDEEGMLFVLGLVSIVIGISRQFSNILELFFKTDLIPIVEIFVDMFVIFMGVMCLLMGYKMYNE